MAAIGWAAAIGLASLTWMLSPIISFFLNKFLSYIYDTSKEIIDPSSGTMKRLPLTLRGVQDWRMQIELAEREAERTELKKQIVTTLDELKDALYIAEDIFDRIEYHKLEQKAGELEDCSWVQWCWMSFYDSIRESLVLKILCLMWHMTLEVTPLVLQLLWGIVRVVVTLPVWTTKEILCWLFPALAPLTSRLVVAAGDKSALLLQCWLGFYVKIRESPAMALQMGKQVLRWMCTSGEHLLPVTCFSSASSWMERFSCWFMSIEFKNRWTSIVNLKDIKMKYDHAKLIRTRCCEDYFLKSYQQTDKKELNSPIMVPLYKVLKETMKNIERLVNSAEQNVLVGRVVYDSIEQAYNIRSSKSAEDREKLMTENAPSTPFITERVFGRDENRIQIREMLHTTRGDTCFSVIGIVGVPGSGKTTLAKYVYQQEQTEKYFELVMWVHVSQSFKVDIIYKEMYAEVSKKFDGNLKSASLAGQLRDKLSKRRFLVVLDDIWRSMENLLPLVSALTVAKTGSKILVTSRHEDVLSRLGPDVRHTTMQISDLDNRSFEELFMYHAVGRKTIHDDDKEVVHEIGNKIAIRLKKSPLLASAVGGALRAKPGPEVVAGHWISVLNQNVLDNHMGILWWCYQHLDVQIKQCFIFCSIFPRRYRLYQDELVNLWVAQGFINTAMDGQEMENVGRGYFEKLVSTSFLKTGGKDPCGTDYFVIHDLMHDIAAKIAGGDCLNIMDGSTQEVPLNVRHLCIESCDAAMLKEDIFKLEKLRTVIIYQSAEDVTEEVLDEMFTKLDKLRVLIFHTERNNGHYHCHTLHFPESIGRLRHMRYLGFKIFGVPSVTLPGRLAKLYLLEVLDLGFNGHFDLSSVKDMKNVIKLRHLISDCPLDCPNISTLTSLQTIPEFDLYKEGSKLQHLKDLNKLQGELVISNLGEEGTREEAIEARLQDKEGLTNLELRWDEFDWNSTATAPEVQADVLECLCPPIVIKYLTISNYEGSRYPSWMRMEGMQGNVIRPKQLEFVCCAKPDADLQLIPVSYLVLRFCDWVTIPIPYRKDLLKVIILDNCEPLPKNIEELTSLQKLIIHSYEDIGILPALPESLRFIELQGYSEYEICHENWDKISNISQNYLDGWLIYDKQFGHDSARSFTALVSAVATNVVGTYGDGRKTEGIMAPSDEPILFAERHNAD